MRTLGRDKSTPKRGQSQTTKAEYGVCGQWKGIPEKWEFRPGEWVNTFVLDDGERLHIIFVSVDKREREEVFKAMGATWSWSKHLAARLLFEAVLLNSKPRIWVHGLITPKVIQRSIAGYEETQADRPEKVRAPWLQNKKREPVEVSERSAEVVMTRL